MNKIVAAIPSYRRPDEQLTLAYLKSLGLKKNEIYIFVQTMEDNDSYLRKYKDDATIIYMTANSVSQARNNILNFFNGECNILMFDDDCKRLAILKNEKLFDITDGNLFRNIINNCFQFAYGKCQVFGIYPVYNAYFMENSISTKVTVNTVLGFVQGYKIRMNPKSQTKEDIEMCGNIIASGGNVLRFNHLCVDAKHRTNNGGCKEVWESNENKKTVQNLCYIFPDIFAPKKNNPSEVRLVCKDRKIKINEGWGTNWKV